MALAVASTSTSTSSNAASIVVTKPTGVTAGDLLLIVSSGYTDETAECTGFSSAISYVRDNPGSIIDTSITLLYRIADASDVSASNYTVTLSGTSTQSQGSVVMMRVTGWSVGNPVWGYAVAGGYADASEYTVGQSGLSITRPSANLVILGVMHQGDSNTATFSGYTITSSDANPTFTEILDTTFDQNTGVFKCAFAVAYALTSSVSDITGYSITAASSSSGDSDGYASFMAVICEPVNESDTNALLSADADFFETSGVSGASGTNTLHTADPVFQTNTGVGGAPSVWTEISKS